jgi:protein Tex
VLESIEARIAAELNVQARQVEATVRLLDDGSTVPFIARYRKEATGGLDDTQLRALSERLLYLRDLEERRAAILRSVEEQGKLGPELRAALESAATKVELEDLYLPYKPKRRTKATIAHEAGLEPLALALLADPALDPLAAAAAYVSEEKGVPDAASALEGARHILIERFAEDAELLAQTRGWVEREAFLVSEVRKGKEEDSEAQRFRDYFAHAEPLARVPGHRALAMLRARKEDVVDLRLGVGPERASLSQDPTEDGQRFVLQRFGLAARGRPADAWLIESARLAFRTRIALHLSAELLVQMRERAEAEAIGVFAANLRDLLLAAPAGAKTILGLDPGLRTGCKVAVVDRTGKVLVTTTIHPHAPRNDWQGSLQILAALCEKLSIELIAIGNGTASRETDKLVNELIRTYPQAKLRKLVVSEAGASVYSASELASQELPELDVSLRGAVSIARRLQDPLAELVKIDPKAIGVGQYQHDVNQTQLARALDGVVEDCVNGVGVDLNTASEALLTRVAGLGTSLAKNIVAHRDARGAFASRAQLLEVPRLGPKAFEPCAGFLRIAGGDNPLDQSAVHPEAYPVVERILAHTQRRLPELLGDRTLLKDLDPRRFTDERFGLPTVTDILAELEKPGRDPRPEFRTASFQEGVEQLSDLRPGMLLEGVVTNVTNFGAFVDIGVHQDGLVHISQLSERFVKDPREVVKAGQIVRVKVLEVDAARKRIALTMKLAEKPAEPRADARRPSDAQRPREPKKRDPREQGQSGPRKQQPVYQLAAQLAKLKLPKK